MSENSDKLKSTSIVDDDNDSAPEDVSFSTSKQVTIEGLNKIRDQVNILFAFHLTLFLCKHLF